MLLVKHEEVGRKNFNDFIVKGNKLSFTELKKLKQNWKTDYVKVQLVETDEVNNYVKSVVDKIDDNTEAVRVLDEEVVNMEKEWFGNDYKNNIAYLDEKLKQGAV